MKIIKTFILSVMCMMIGLMIVDFGANNCKAANISDKTWSFALSLTNYVNECGGDAAVVSFRGYVGYGNAVGKWSPDSIGSYTVLSQLR